jgi:hypothetical protein
MTMRICSLNVFKAFLREYPVITNYVSGDFPRVAFQSKLRAPPNTSSSRSFEAEKCPDFISCSCHRTFRASLARGD